MLDTFAIAAWLVCDLLLTACLVHALVSDMQARRTAWVLLAVFAPIVLVVAAAVAVGLWIQSATA